MNSETEIERIYYNLLCAEIEIGKQPIGKYVPEYIILHAGKREGV